MQNINLTESSGNVIYSICDIRHFSVTSLLSGCERL